MRRYYSPRAAMIVNKRQRQWINQFIETRPNARLTSTYKDLDNIVVVIEWREQIVNALTNSNTAVRGNIYHRISVKLSRTGKPKRTADYFYRVEIPQKQELDYCPQGQLVLDLPQIYEFKAPTNPVVVKRKHGATRKKTPKPVQQSLPLFGVSADLLKIEGVVKSEQELLSETIPHKTLEGKQINLPAAIVKILTQKQATFKEWEGAIDLYQVAGPSAVLIFLESLDFIREHFGSKPVQKVKNQEVSIQKVVVK